MASRAARPCSTTGTVKTDPGTALLAKLDNGVTYTCSAINRQIMSNSTHCTCGYITGR